MAKHMVKCFYCGQQFDASREPFVMAKARRYAHKSCAENYQSSLTQEQKDRQELENYIKILFHTTSISTKIEKQIEKYISENHYSYSGIQRSLFYFYEIKKNSLDKANGGIGIVPYIYQEAYNYYYTIWLAQQQNQDKVIQDYKPQEIVITIPPPQRKIKKRKLFRFLDEEANNE